MNTKEAIEFLESLKGNYRDIDYRILINEYGIEEVIKQLQQYKQMWEELYDYSTDPEEKFKMEELKQKYFPKEAIK